MASFIPRLPGEGRKAASEHTAARAGPSGHRAVRAFPHSPVACAVFPLQEPYISPARLLTASQHDYKATGGKMTGVETTYAVKEREQGGRAVGGLLNVEALN